jgi:hypothetical protein
MLIFYFSIKTMLLKLIKDIVKTFVNVNKNHLEQKKLIKNVNN